MKKALLFVMLVLLASATGCSMYSLVPSGNSQYTIVNARAHDWAEAPVNDRNDDYVQRVGLYFVSSDRQQLTTISRTLTVRYDTTLLQCIVERLLSASSSDGVLGVFPKGTKLLSVEESCDTITVDISGEAMNASAQELLWMKSAIANSVLAPSSAKYAHVLVNGREQGNCLVPTGALKFTAESLQALWTKAKGENDKIAAGKTAQAARNVVIYYPAASGEYILAQTRPVTFTSKNVETAIAGELAKAPENALCVAAFDKTTAPAKVEAIQLSDGGRVVKLNFNDDIYSAVENYGMSAWRFFASITYTLCRNVPDIDGVIVLVGDDWVFEVNSPGKSARFREGIMRPEDFSDAVADDTTLYFGADGGGLKPVSRVMNAKTARSPRAVINALISGPLASENCIGLFPKGVTTDDVLGIGVYDNAALVNLSSDFYSLCQDISFERERDLVYSVVNTLCAMDGVNRARIFINGESADTLADSISVNSELLPNPGLIRDISG